MWDTIKHRYKCTSHECGKGFVISKEDNYDDSPSGRKCIFCESSGVSYHGPHNYTPPVVHSDCVGASINGIQSMADGKYYDSKSAYYASLKAQGLTVVGNDASVEKAAPKTEEINWSEAVAETIQQLK